MHKMLTLTRPQTTASRSEATAVHGSRHTAPSHSLQAAMACRARKTVLWLVCKDPSRSLLGASRITCRALKGQINRDRLPPTPSKVVPVHLSPRAVFLRRPTSWRGETSDLNSSPFVPGSGSLGVSTPVRTPSWRRSPTKPLAQKKKHLDG
jgi:hypothetical protein